jgi:DNA-binding TFAR19-related protein (PDSD5 family)
VTTLSEDLPDTLKLKLMKRIMNKAAREWEKTTGRSVEDPEQLVRANSDEKALELLDKIKLKYPEIYSVLISELYRAIKSGKIASISGTLVYNIITMLNLDVKPDIKIKFVKRGRKVGLRDYIE